MPYSRWGGKYNKASILPAGRKRSKSDLNEAIFYKGDAATTDKSEIPTALSIGSRSGYKGNNKEAPGLYVRVRPSYINNISLVGDSGRTQKEEGEPLVTDRESGTPGGVLCTHRARKVSETSQGNRKILISIGSVISTNLGRRSPKLQWFLRKLYKIKRGGCRGYNLAININLSCLYSSFSFDICSKWVGARCPTVSSEQGVGIGLVYRYNKLIAREVPGGKLFKCGRNARDELIFVPEFCIFTGLATGERWPDKKNPSPGAWSTVQGRFTYKYDDYLVGRGRSGCIVRVRSKKCTNTLVIHMYKKGGASIIIGSARPKGTKILERLVGPLIRNSLFRTSRGYRRNLRIVSRRPPSLGIDAKKGVRACLKYSIVWIQHAKLGGCLKLIKSKILRYKWKINQRI